MGPLLLPRIIGHRGAAGYAPENTLASMYKAKALGASWVEFDVQLTRDGVFVVFHDKNLKRTTNGVGKIYKKNYSDIAALDAGSWFGDGFKQEKIPTLIEIISYLGSLQLSANIELKPVRGQEKIMAEKLVSLLETFAGKMINPPLLSSFSIKTLRHVRHYSSTVLVGLLLSRWRRDWRSLVNELNCSSVHLKHSLYSLKRVKLLKESGCKLLAYTVNDSLRARKLFNAGVDAVFSDYPDRI